MSDGRVSDPAACLRLCGGGAVGAIENAQAAERAHRQARKNRMLARGYLDWLKHVRHRQHLTVWQYGGKLDDFLAFAGERALDELTLSELETWLDRPRRGGRRGAAATLAGEVAVVRGFYRYLLAHGHLRTNRATVLAAPTVRTANPRAIEDAAWLRVWDADLQDDERVALTAHVLLQLAPGGSLRPTSRSGPPGTPATHWLHPKGRRTSRLPLRLGSAALQGTTSAPRSRGVPLGP
jgi:hypothetical protein